MIAMQYTIRLAGDFDLDALRERVQRRKPLFDVVDGLLHKAYLFNPTQLIYAPFYIWRSDDEARAFLTGDLFRDLIDTFGRPRVRTWNVLAFGANPAHGTEPVVAVKELDIVAAEQDLAGLTQQEIQRHDRALGLKGLCFHVTAIDPDRWELMRYSAWCDASQVKNCDADVVETFDILKLCAASRAA